MTFTNLVVAFFSSCLTAIIASFVNQKSNSMKDRFHFCWVVVLIFMTITSILAITNASVRGF